MCNVDFHLPGDTNGAGEEIGSGNLKRRRLGNLKILDGMSMDWPGLRGSRGVIVQAGVELTARYHQY